VHYEKGFEKDSQALLLVQQIKWLAMRSRSRLRWKSVRGYFTDENQKV